MTTDFGHIYRFIPQRPPFVMVDHLLTSKEKVSSSALKVREGNIFVENGHLTEPGLLENIAQTAAAGIGEQCLSQNMPVPVGYIGAIQNLEIFGLPKINDEIITEVTIKNQIFNVTAIEGKIYCARKLLAQCDMKIFIPNQQ
jgi:3-hydroxymyristoyl/3-hydroxydecanoyl-(acyl carrier protein) dehydratase